LDSGAIGRDKEILVINLPDRNQFETINPVKAPDLFDVPASGSIRAKKSFSNNSGCSNVPVISNYRKILGKELKGVQHFFMIHSFSYLL
jgi:hypothetical protein